MADLVTIVLLNTTLPEVPDFPSLESPNFEGEVKATCDGIDLMGGTLNDDFKTQLNNIIGQINNNLTWMNENLAVFVQVGDDITKVITVADNIAKVVTVADNINNVVTVADSIGNVNNVGSNITKVATVADNIQAILNLEAIKDKIVSVEEIKDKISITADNISKVIIASDNIDAINTVVANIDNINLLAVQADNIQSIGENITALLDVANNIDTVVNAKNTALNAKDEAVSARDEAITAKDTAVTAKNLVVDATFYRGVWEAKEYNEDDIVRQGSLFYVSLIDNNSYVPNGIENPNIEASASSNTECTVSHPEYGFDLSINRGWGCSQNPATEGAQYLKCTINRKIVKYSIYRNFEQECESSTWGDWNSIDYSPKEWEFQGSNDGSNWTILDTRTNESIGDKEEKEYTIANPDDYMYYRIYITANVGGGNGINITVLKLFSDGSTWIEFAGSGTGSQLPDKTGKTGYFLGVNAEGEEEWISLILPAPTAQTNWTMDEETTLTIPITNYNSAYTYIIEPTIGTATLSNGNILFSPSSVPNTQNYPIKAKVQRRGFFDSDYLTINVTVNNLQLPTPQLSTITEVSHLAQAIFDILNFDSSYTYNIENEQNGTVTIDTENRKIIFTPTLQTTTPVQGGFSVYVSKAGETASDSLDVSFDIIIPKLETPVFTGETVQNWNEPFEFTINNYDSNNTYIAQNVVGGSVSVNGNTITFNAAPVSSQTTGSFEIKVVRTNYQDSDSISKTLTITVPKLQAPVLSGANNANEEETLIITIDNYDANNTYIISKGSIAGDTISITLPNVDQDTQDSVTVKATRANYQDSDEIIFNYTILNVPIVADNAIQITNFDTLSSATNAEIQSGDIVATADSALASVLSPEQEAGETDWVKYRNIAKYIPKEIILDADTTKDEIITTQEIIGQKNVNIITSATEFLQATVDFQQSSVSSVNNVDPLGDGSGVALWQFDGNANDTGGNYNGIWSGTEAYDTGKFGQAASFDGSSYISLFNGDTLDDAIVPNLGRLSAASWGGWIKCTGEASIINTGGWLFHLIVQSGGTIRANMSDADGNASAITNETVNDGGWHFILAIWDANNNSGKLFIYIDGVEATYSSSSGRTTILASNTSSGNLYLTVASNYNQSSKYIQGTDQVRIFNRALTAEEVNVLYTEGATKYSADITALALQVPPTRVFFDKFPIFLTKTNTEEITQTLDSRSWNGSSFTDTYLSAQPTNTFRQLEYKWSEMDEGSEVTEIHTDLWKEG